MGLSCYSYLQSVEGGTKNPPTAAQEVVDLSKFLHMANNKECDISNVTFMSHIINYLNRLRQSGVGPSGQITKLSTITNALRMVVSMVPDDGGDDETKNLVVRVKVVETKVKGITKSLRKECSAIRLEKRELFDGGSDLSAG